jgi:hypothetical protein
MEKDKPEMTEVAIPARVPSSLRTAYSEFSARFGEEEAASQIRSRKRNMTPKELRHDAEADRRNKLGFKARSA